MNQKERNNSNKRLYKIYNINQKLKFRDHFHIKDQDKNQNKDVNIIKMNIVKYQRNK